MEILGRPGGEQWIKGCSERMAISLTPMPYVLQIGQRYVVWTRFWHEHPPRKFMRPTFLQNFQVHMDFS